MSRWRLARWIVIGAVVLGGAGLYFGLRDAAQQAQFLTAPV